jgi:hypothetical protein
MQQTLDRFEVVNGKIERAAAGTSGLKLHRLEVARPEGERLSPTQRFGADIVAAMED